MRQPNRFRTRTRTRTLTLALTIITTLTLTLTLTLDLDLALTRTLTRCANRHNAYERLMRLLMVLLRCTVPWLVFQFDTYIW